MISTTRHAAVRQRDQWIHQYWLRKLSLRVDEPIKEALTGGRRESSIATIQRSRSGAPAVSGKLRRLFTSGLKEAPLCIIVCPAQISAQRWKSRPTQRFCKTYRHMKSPLRRLNERPCRRYLFFFYFIIKVLMTVLNTFTTKLGDTKPSKQVDGDSPLLSHAAADIGQWFFFTLKAQPQLCSNQLLLFPDVSSWRPDRGRTELLPGAMPVFWSCILFILFYFIYPSRLRI